VSIELYLFDRVSSDLRKKGRGVPVLLRSGGVGAVCGVGASWDLFFCFAAEGANGAKIVFL